MRYFYHFNFPASEKELWQLEVKSLFKQTPVAKFLISEEDVDINRSPFIKARIDIMGMDPDYEELCFQIARLKLKYSNFKIIFYHHEDNHYPYQDSLKKCQDISWLVAGRIKLNKPDHTLALTYYQGYWLFGYYHHGKPTWLIHEHKPYSFSNSLDVKLARVLINLVVGNDQTKSLVDPCCGVGTVVLEGLALRQRIRGFDISRKLVAKARKNLAYYHYDPGLIYCADIADLNWSFDGAIIDLPYNLYTPITLDQQVRIIKSAFHICDKLVLVTYEEMDTIIKEAGFKLISKVYRAKTEYVDFGRYIYVCKKHLG